MTVIGHEGRPLRESDLPSLVGLAARTLTVDGGLPLASGESFLRRRFLAGVVASTGVFAGEGNVDLAAAAAVRPIGDGVVAVVGMVDPTCRGRGFGGAILDWALDAAGDSPARVETESLTPEADALFRSRGLQRTFAEDVMRYDLSGETPPVSLPADVVLTEWSPSSAARFFAVYDAAFRERPGFPAWTEQQWVGWISDDEDFAPEWTLLATRAGEDVGFVASARGAWIVQVGTVPAARGAGIGAALTAEALRRMRAGGEVEALLDVNLDNPGAARVYDQLGFERIGRRARYEHQLF